MAAGERWTVDDIPDLSGRLALVTGGNSGLGFETGLALAGAGAQVVLACRDGGRASRAVEAIRARHPGSRVGAMALDLASLASVREFAKAFSAEHDRLHILCNNAGVMALPYRVTADGFEMQFGTNHLGHFALTGLLLEKLAAAGDDARIVTVSSTMHRIGRIRFDDLQWTRGYRKWRAYGQSKLANLLFAYELQRRLEAAGADLRSLAAHPGYAATNLQATGPQMAGSSAMERVMHFGNRFFSQSAAMGAQPTLRAATSPDARGGDYYGPGGPFEMAGPPVKVRSSRRSHDRDVARGLWEVSSRLTGVAYEALA